MYDRPLAEDFGLVATVRPWVPSLLFLLMHYLSRFVGVYIGFEFLTKNPFRFIFFKDVKDYIPEEK